MIHWLTKLLAKILGAFESPAALALEKQLAELTEAALPIVQAIAALAPNKTVQEIAAAYEQYGVPMAAQIADDPTSTGNAMLNLATAVLQKLHAPAAAVSMLNTAVQLALVAGKLKV